MKKSKPELADVLNDLIKPAKISELAKAVNQNNSSENGQDNMDVDENNEESDQDESKLPVSISQPKAYQFWSG